MMWFGFSPTRYGCNFNPSSLCRRRLDALIPNLLSEMMGCGSTFRRAPAVRDALQKEASWILCGTSGSIEDNTEQRISYALRRDPRGVRVGHISCYLEVIRLLILLT